MSAVWLNSVGVVGPGLDGWAQAARILSGQAPFAYRPLEPIEPELLPANERRRTTPTIRLAMHVAHEAVGRDVASERSGLHSVFASAEGDTEIAAKICQALALPGRPVSPTQFHNSVHNAPAGYWAIATGWRSPYTSLAAGDATFSAALLEAFSTVVSDKVPVLLVAYDLPAPEPLTAAAPVTEAFALALTLAPDHSHAALGQLELSLSAGNPTVCLNHDLERLRRGNPIASALPLLEVVAMSQDREITLTGTGMDAVRVGFTPTA